MRIEMEKLMQRNRITLSIYAVLLICFANAADAQIAIAVNKDNPVDDISMSELKQIYLGKKTSFPDGKNIVLAEYADLKKTFYDILLDWSVTKMKKHWMGLIFSGTSSSAPKEFRQSGELKDFILRNEGAIAFMNLAEADKNVKLLTVNGKRPGSKDYPLQ